MVHIISTHIAHKATPNAREAEKCSQAVNEEEEEIVF